MGRSRADNTPATSPARFRRKSRPADPTVPLPGFPSPFGQPAPDPAPANDFHPRPPNTQGWPVDPQSDQTTARHSTKPLHRPETGFPIPDSVPPTARTRAYETGGYSEFRPESGSGGADSAPTPGSSESSGRTARADSDTGARTSRKRFSRPGARTPEPIVPEAASEPRMAWVPPGPDAQAQFGFGSAEATYDHGRSAAEPGPAPESSGRKRGRVARVAREMLAPTGVGPEELAQRLPDTLRGVGEQALVAVRKWADPRERELRKRRRTRRRSLRLGTAGGLTTAGTVGLVLISAPAWAVIVVGGGAVALVTGTAVTAKRYLQLRKEPLPQAAFAPRKLPPIRSAARASISRLVRAERALHGLSAQIERSGRLPAEDLSDTLETASSGAAALHALAADMVAMEQAANVLGPRNSPLAEHVQAITIRLDGGVAEFEGMVAAAARVLAVPESAAITDDLGWAMVGLRDAADRLDGWAQALTDLADDRYRANP
ncbi:hypothetical protein [Nocardia sp. NPDC056100]|uniref:phage shock envelope stress response protein PspM n=1 Tax=Nocardia sp. NPDC056100 TaxID=3345712 RepID=UPI0035E0394A